MGSTPSPPAAPNPYTTASAQGTVNAQTATANALLNNPNIIGPYGTSTTSQTGSQTFTNPDGSTYQLPTFTQTQSLSPQQQLLLDQNNQLAQNTNSTALNALNSISGTLSNPITSDQLSPLQLSSGYKPNLATSFDQGGPIQTSYDQGGPIQKSVAYDLAGTDAHQNTNALTQFGPTSTAVKTSLGNTDFTQATLNAQNAVLARLQPTTDRANANLQARLANQGVTAGSSAYNAANLAQAQQNNDLALGAVATGDQEQQALYGQTLSSGQFSNAAQEQEYEQALGRGAFANAGIAQNNAAALNEAQYGLSATEANNTSRLNAGNFANSAQAQQNAENATQAGFYNQAIGQQYTQNQGAAAFSNAAANQNYQNQIAGRAFSNQAAGQQLQQAMALQNQQINEISALRSGGQVTAPNFPGYAQSQVDQTPISADVYQTAAIQNQQYQAQLQNQAANNSALFGTLGSMAGMFKFSDRRLKTDIARVATARNGLPIYLYRYRGETGLHLGFMADEVRRIRPEAVATHANGFDMINYESAAA